MGVEIAAGAVFHQGKIPFIVETKYDWVGEGTGARQEPICDYWQIGERETQYGTTADGYGRFELHVIEVLDTATCGKVAIYERRWFDPDGEPLGRRRKRFSRIGNLRAFISRRKMTTNPEEQSQ